MAAAAAGVISSESTSSAPTVGTASPVATPINPANSTDSARTGTPRARATSASTLANSSGRQTRASTASTPAAHPASSHTSLRPTATIWPNSRESWLEERPG